MGTFKELLVWQRSIELAKLVYDYTISFPVEERFGLTNQMRRCAVSIPSNIAEGYGRATDSELVHFMYISRGSCNELETQLILAYHLAFITEDKFNHLVLLIAEINKMISSLIYRRKQGLDTNMNQGCLATKGKRTKI